MDKSMGASQGAQYGQYPPPPPGQAMYVQHPQQQQGGGGMGAGQGCLAACLVRPNALHSLFNCSYHWFGTWHLLFCSSTQLAAAGALLNQRLVLSRMEPAYLELLLVHEELTVLTCVACRQWRAAAWWETHSSEVGTDEMYS